MGVALSFLLLISFLVGFFGLEQFAQALQAAGIANVSGDEIVMASVGGFQLSVSMSALRIFLAAGAVFFQFVVIMTSMFDRVVDSLRVIVRPLLMLIPIITFLYSAFNTFEPIVKSLLPTELGGANPAYVTEAATNDLPRNLLITFGAMLFYLLMSSVLGGGGTSEINTLRAELRRCREQQRRG